MCHVGYGTFSCLHNEVLFIEYCAENAGICCSKAWTSYTNQQGLCANCQTKMEELVKEMEQLGRKSVIRGERAGGV